MRIVLQGLSLPIKNLWWETSAGVRIGRRQHLEIVLPSAAAENLHAEIRARDRSWVIADLSSLAGTFVNGVNLEGGACKLRLHDIVRVGDLALKVARLDDGRAPAIATETGVFQVRAAAQRSWEQALKVASALAERSPANKERLLALLRAGFYLCHIASLDELLKSIVRDAVNVLQAKRGAIVLWEESADELRLGASCIRGKRNPAVLFSRTLVRRALRRGESLLFGDIDTQENLEHVSSVKDGGMSSIVCALIRTPRKRLGVLHLDRGPFAPAFTSNDLNWADALAAHVGSAIEVSQLLRQQRKMFLQTVASLAQAVELRDRYTGGHTRRVTTYSLLLAQKLGLPIPQRQQIEMGTPLHDIGKIGIQDAILNKPGRLTAAEFEKIKVHPAAGAAILQNIGAMSALLPIVRHHHEHWDGRGYPDGLAKEKIPFLARIVAVADAFDAMTSNRPYRPAMPLEQAFAELSQKAGSHFDPKCVTAFLNLRRQIEALHRAGRDS